MQEETNHRKIYIDRKRTKIMGKKFVKVKKYKRANPGGTYKVVSVRAHARCRPRKEKKCR